jgi:hypothetical protein
VRVQLNAHLESIAELEPALGVGLGRERFVLVDTLSLHDRMRGGRPVSTHNPAGERDLVRLAGQRARGHRLNNRPCQHASQS